jgi:hypothetical protein
MQSEIQGTTHLYRSRRELEDAVLTSAEQIVRTACALVEAEAAVG